MKSPVFIRTPDCSKIMGKNQSKKHHSRLKLEKPYGPEVYHYRVYYKKVIGKPDIA